MIVATAEMWKKWTDVVIEVTEKRIRKGKIDQGHVIDRKESVIVVTEKGIRIVKTENQIYAKATSKLKRNQLMVSRFFKL